ncbi:MAG: hypothetical protein JSS14_12415 [Proteobacteria bacterium]|nr:hypothetical protein [Pseudomonadota bacterium]
MRTHLPAWVLAAAALAVAAGPAWSQQGAEPPVRLRGVVQSVTASTVTVKERRGETIALGLAPSLVIQEVFPIELGDIKPGSFIGTATVPQPDGAHRAIAVTVFPESARGAGEGSRPFDLQPDSTMTNATVADLAEAPSGRTLHLKYKDGEKAVVVPVGTPVVSFRPGDRGLLVPGASVSMTAQVVNGTPTAQRINAGRSGFELPY